MRSSSFRATMLFALLCLSFFIAMAMIVSRFSDTIWLLELPAHFRAHLTIVAALTAVVFLTLRAWRHAVFGLIVTGLVGAPVVALWVPAERSGRGEVALKVLSLNVSFYSRNYDEVIALLEAIDPDVIGLVEINTLWVEELAPLDDVYPHRAVYARRRGSGVAVLSRVPFEGSEIRAFPGTGRHFAVANLSVGGRALTVGVAHAVSPLGGNGQAEVRNQQLRTLAGVRREFADREVMLMGDFNTSPWSVTFRRLVDSTDLRNAADGFGYLPTWPAQRPWLGIPIDHHLVSDGIAVSRFSVVGPTGSDHLAVYTELGFR